MTEPIYQFSNGILVRRCDLADFQLDRYAVAGNPNLHEPVEEDWITRVMERSGSAAPTFLDVGAGIGYYTVLVKKRWPTSRVFAVEALPRHAAAIRLTLALNNIDPSAVTIIQIAVGTRNGTASLVDEGYGSHLAGFFGGTNSVRVEMQRLDDLLTRTGHIDVMKIDIQGAELEVLKSAKKSLVAQAMSHIVIGTHSKKIHGATAQLLSDHAYDILFDDPAPPMQPDGLIVAAARGAK